MTLFLRVFLVAFCFCVSCKTPSLVSDGLPNPDETDTDTVGTVKLKTDQQLGREKEHLLFTYKGSRERKFDLLHTGLDLKFDYDSQKVNGEARLILKPHFYDQEILELDAKDFDIHEVWLEENSHTQPLATRYDERVVTVYLPRTFTNADTINIGMRYTANPNMGSGQGSKAITDNKGLYFINPYQTESKPVQIWTQGETEHNSKWFPTIDSPNERATQDIKLTVEEQYLTVSNGRLQSQTNNTDGTRTDHWMMDLAHAPYLAAVVVGEFAEVKDSVDGLPLRYLVESKYEKGAKEVFQNTPEMVRFFSRILGVPFPWQKYDQVVVRDFVSGAMENTTVSIFMEDLNLDSREAIDSEWDYIIAHELFHQWFGNFVTLESWANLPLNESFADYSEYLWMEYKEGRDKADMHHILATETYLAEAGEKQVDMIRFHYEDGEDMFDSHSYAKGGRILHMLRKYLGDEAFFASLNYYLNQHAFSSVEIHDLRLAFEKVTGKDLNWFFNQWFLASGHPILDISFDYNHPENILLTIKQKQDLNTTPLYKIPFKVSWYKGGKREEVDFVLEQVVQQFALENGKDTDLVMFDESLELLAERQSYHGRDYLKNQATLSQSGISRYEALDSLSNNYPFDAEMASILSTALKDSFSSIRELALAKIRTNIDTIPMSEEGEERVLAMAKEDPDNKVKSSAIELLSIVGKEKYAPLFLELINDSSFYVAGAALAAYLENDLNTERKKVADEFSDADNIRVIVPLSDYFTTMKDTSKADWFHEKLDKLKGEQLYYFTGYYGDYFARLTENDPSVAIEKLYKLARDNTAGYVRLAAFQALFGFIDEEGVLEKARQVHAEEKDSMVKDYQQFFLEGYVGEN